jgi:hypothetical protein
MRFWNNNRVARVGVTQTHRVGAFCCTRACAWLPLLHFSLCARDRDDDIPRANRPVGKTNLIVNTATHIIILARIIHETANAWRNDAAHLL